MTLPEGAADVNDGNDEKAQLSKGNSESSELALVNEETIVYRRCGLTDHSRDTWPVLVSKIYLHSISAPSD